MITKDVLGALQTGSVIMNTGLDEQELLDVSVREAIKNQLIWTTKEVDLVFMEKAGS